MSIKTCECGADYKVINSRLIAPKNCISRRRKCEKCGMRFSTIEMTNDMFQSMIAEIRKLDNMKDMLSENHGMAARLTMAAIDYE